MSQALDCIWATLPFSFLPLSLARLIANQGTESVDLRDNHSFHSIHVLLFFECEVEFLRDGCIVSRPLSASETIWSYRLANRLVVRVMPHCKVWVVESLLARDTFRRIEGQHLAEQIDRKGVGVGVERLECNPRLDGERSNIILCLIFDHDLDFSSI